MSNTTIDKVVRRFVVADNGDKRDYYTGVLPSDYAKLLTFVPVAQNSSRTFLEEITTDGYQRPGSAARMGLFAKFVAEHPLSVVPPVVLSGRNNWAFKSDKNSDFGSLIVSGRAAIIDGQHRLGGYVKLWDTSQVRRDVGFILLPDLSLPQEREEFLAINNTQKGVEKSLTTLLEGSEEALVGVELDERSDSPFKGRIQQVKKAKEHLFSLAAVAKNVGRTFGNGAFADLDVDKKTDIMIGYWKAISKAWPEEWADINKPDAKSMEFKLLETTGLIAWSFAANEILAPSFEPKTQTVNWAAVSARMQKLADAEFVDWAKDGMFSNATGEVGGKLIHKRIQLGLASL